MRITFHSAAVLQALASGKAFGMDIIEFCNFPSGTVYPILRRLERAGLVESSWESQAEAADNRRPQRRNYRLTGQGRTALAGARQRYRHQAQLFDLAAPDGRTAH